MTNTATVATSFFVGLFFYSVAIADDAQQPAQWLFVHTAETAEMTSPSTLAMPATREVFAFTDRPNRLHAYLNAHEFVTLWDDSNGNSFRFDPPNAVLTWSTDDVVREAEVVILDAEVVDFGRFISYEVQLSTGEVPS